MQTTVRADLPPYELCTHLLQHEPGRDVCLVIEVGDHDLVALTQRLTHCQTDQADEGRGVHAERDFLRPPGIDERSNAGPRTSDRGLNRHALRVAPAPLHVMAD